MDPIQQILELSFGDRIFEQYPVSFIIMVLSGFGYLLRYIIYWKQTRTIVEFNKTLLSQIEYLLQKKDIK